MQSLPYKIITSFTDASANWDWLNKKLFKNSSSITASDPSIVDSTYGAEEANVINNLRIRVNELEARLQALDFLE